MVLVVMVFQCCVTTLPSCGVGGNLLFQCCVTTLPSCGVGGNGVSVLCNHSAKLWCWW